MQLLTKPIDEIKANPRNARTHDRRQIQKLVASIQSFGFRSPLLVDEVGIIIAGHGRLAAALELGLTEVPVIVVEGLSEAEKRGLALADNRIALDAGWDLDTLAIELRELSAIDLDFAIEATGFDTSEIDLVLDGQTSVKTDSREDQVPAVGAAAVTRPGDLWLLGEHRLLCGDTRDPGGLAKLMREERARLAFADPPYNVQVNGHVCGLGSIQHREFAMASGEMTDQEFTAFLMESCRNAAAVSVDGAIHFICMDWRHISELATAGRQVYSELKNICVWAKDNGGMGSFYRSQHELVFVFKVGTARHVNNIELGRMGRYRTNVWEYAGVNTLRSGRLDDLSMHPTVKPVALVADAIKDCSRRNEIVLDPFAGSGTTILAAQKTGRRARAIEIDPLYVDVALRRWETFSDRPAVLEATAQSFEEVATTRKQPCTLSSNNRMG